LLVGLEGFERLGFGGTHAVWPWMAQWSLFCTVAKNRWVAAAVTCVVFVLIANG
jgi:hypothetical protein